MKNYTITVNGNVYNVTVEEGTTAGAAPTVSAAKAAPAAPKGERPPPQLFAWQRRFAPHCSGNRRPAKRGLPQRP